MPGEVESKGKIEEAELEGEAVGTGARCKRAMRWSSTYTLNIANNILALGTEGRVATVIQRL